MTKLGWNGIEILSQSRAAVGSDVRLEKVAVLKRAIEAGTYRVSSAALADRLIASMLQQGALAGTSPQVR